MATEHLVQIRSASRGNLDLLASFPYDRYPKPLKNQLVTFEKMEEADGVIVLQSPTGSGKTCIAYTYLSALETTGKRQLFYIVPNKTIVNQVKELHPDMAVAYGRNEHECLYYEDKPRADEIPCSLLVDCIHRVDQQTGKTMEPGAEPCPYLLQKFKAKQARKVVCTFAFYLYTGPVFSNEFGNTGGMVVDEVHRIAQIVRSALSYDITDYHLEQAVAMLNEVGAKDEAALIDRFRSAVIRVGKRRPKKSLLLDDWEIDDLIKILEGLNRTELRRKVKAAVQEKRIETKERRVMLKKLETLVRDLNRYLTSLEYALPAEHRKPSNFVYATYKREMGDRELVQHRITIKAYKVAPLIKRMLPKRTLAMSATIGDPEVFGWETGIRGTFISLDSEFSPKKTRLFLPVDTPNLAKKNLVKGEPNRTLRLIVDACRRFNRHGLRCLVVLVSEKEREKFLDFAMEEGVDVISYGKRYEMTPKKAAEMFKEGAGDVLVGTVANYSEGIDLPKRTAPVIFFLRPGYASPDDPVTQFEERRFGGGQVWAVRNWRVVQEALQVRGRNIRSSKDEGVTFFVSQQFRRFLYGSLPSWLHDAYRGDVTFEGAIRETLKLLK